MGCQLSENLIESVTEFHGHWCPGLAIGIRAAELALAEVGRAGDEDVVAVVETDMCGVDAVQFLTGCTFGKGNLIHRDYGKHAFSFYRRGDGKSLRIVARGDLFGDAGEKLRALQHKMSVEGLSEEERSQWEALRSSVSRRVMRAELDALFDVKPVNEPVPEKARILDSLVCERCGEPVMQTRLRRRGERRLCIPCFERGEP
jgi:formylmethanofuran dehydrogenase subunit E